MQKAKVGSVEIIALVDNVMTWPAAEVFPAATHEQLATFRPELDPEGGLALNFGCFLLLDQSRVVLVDTGWGPEFDGRLLDELRAADIDRNQVDAVLFTHLHGDHTGWNIDRASGEPIFPRARFLVPKADCNHYSAEEPPNESFQRDILPLVAMERVDLFDGVHRISDALTTVPTPGHTPGHTSVSIASEGALGYILGDVIVSTVDAARPEWVNSFDTDPALAGATRLRVLSELLESQALVGASHIATPGLGRFVKRDGATGWEPLAT